MFIGHIGVALAAKRYAPRTSLGLLVLAAQLADTLWPIFLLLGAETVRIAPSSNPFLNFQFTSYPYSHSLVALVIWGAAFALIYTGRTGDRRGARVLALLVVSHWVLDFVSHRPDMPLWPGSATFGFGMWNNISLTIIVETVTFVAGVAIYATSTHAADRTGRWGFTAFVAALYVLFFASMGPPPQTVRPLAIGALIGALVFSVWAWWVDRHRVPVDPGVSEEMAVPRV